MLLLQAYDNVRKRITEYISAAYVDITRHLDRTLNLYTRRSGLRSYKPTKNWGRPDYPFWRRVYFGRVEGLQISGLFVRPIVNKIAAWVLGRSPDFMSTSKRVQTELSKWWDKNHADIIAAYAVSLLEGDCFFVINADLTITIVPAEAVNPIVDSSNYSLRIGWKIVQVFPHPDNSAQKMTVTDEYYIDRRIHTEEFSDGRKRVNIYPNLIGMIPVIHIANFPMAGEEFGHPEVEALIEIFLRYGQTLDAAIEGNILQGRPTPVLAFNSVTDLNAFWRRYGRKETTRSSDGTVQEIETLSVDMSDLLTISNADFNYRSPGPFAEDTERLLGLMFYLILEHIELPEFVLGNAIEGSKASAETQMPIFEVFIRMRQKTCAKWILPTLEIVNRYISLMKPGVPVTEIMLRWAKISQNGRLTLETVTWAFENNLLDEKLALLLLPADIENPDEVLKLAKKEAEIRKEQQMKDLENTMKIQSENAPKPAGGGSRASEMDPDLAEQIREIFNELLERI